MSKQVNYWNGIFEQYKSSGLTQLVFCKENKLSYNQFQYRWGLYTRAKKTGNQVNGCENNALLNLFEPISLATSPSMLRKEQNSVAELVIHLPNQIRCDIKISLCSDTIAMLLKQLVSIC